MGKDKENCHDETKPNPKKKETKIIIKEPPANKHNYNNNNNFLIKQFVTT